MHDEYVDKLNRMIQSIFLFNYWMVYVHVQNVGYPNYDDLGEQLASSNSELSQSNYYHM